MTNLKEYIPLNDMNAIFYNHYDALRIKYHHEDGTGMFVFTYSNN